MFGIHFQTIVKLSNKWKAFYFVLINGFNLNANLKKDFRIYFIIRKIQFLIVKTKELLEKKIIGYCWVKKSHKHIQFVAVNEK